jgi:hypothetical protein
MLRDEFKRDLEEAKTAEKIVLDTFASLSNNIAFVDVSNNRECFYKGDIKAISADGAELYIEVKDDKRIAETGNILCEEEVYYKEYDYFAAGNMSCQCDYYCIVSQSNRVIYVLDFAKLKEIYKKYGEYKVIKHASQDTYCYLLELCWASKHKALLYKIKY